MEGEDVARPVLARPKVITQLDGTIWGPKNCAFATAASLAFAASGGKVRVTPIQMRRRAGDTVWVDNAKQEDVDRLGPANIKDQKRAILNPRTVQEFADVGLRPPRMRNLGSARPKDVRSYLARGATVSVAIGYHVINEQAPNASGQRDFRTKLADGHSVRLQGLFHADKTPVKRGELWDQQNFTYMVDPLANGRVRDGRRVAWGPQFLPLRIVFAAAAAVPINGGTRMLGEGQVLAMAVFPSRPLQDDHDGQDDHDDEPSAACAGVEQQRDAALSRVADLEDVIRAVRAEALEATGELAKVVDAASVKLDDVDGTAPGGDEQDGSDSLNEGGESLVPDPPTSVDTQILAEAKEPTGPNV
jgi:hypothetical protein